MDNPLLSPKEQLVEDLQFRLQEIDKRLRENNTIIEQNQLEVDRLQQKSVNVSAQLKRVEDNFDTVPRQDIRVAYESAIDSRTRLVSMRSQLEKLQDAQQYLHEYRDTLVQTLEMIEGVSISGVAAVGDAGHDLGALGGDQVIRIIEAQEDERKRLANALHDGPAQSLTNFILQAEICQRLFDRDPDSASSELNNLKSAASVTFQKVRDFIFELRPMMLDDLGLIATLRRHAENHNQKHEDSEIEFHLTGAEERFPKHVEMTMFRALQMLMANSIDVLSAKKVDIKLDNGDGRLLAVVEDNGRYFDPDAELSEGGEESEFRLQSLAELRERLEMVGGKLEVFSVEGEGNTFEINMPFTKTG